MARGEYPRRVLIVISCMHSPVLQAHALQPPWKPQHALEAVSNWLSTRGALKIKF